MLNPDQGADDTSSVGSDFPPPDSVLFESIAGELHQSTASPEWLDRVKSAGGNASSITDHLPLSRELSAGRNALLGSRWRRRAGVGFLDADRCVWRQDSPAGLCAGR